MRFVSSTAFVVVVGVALVTLIGALPQQPANPVIGIVTSPMSDCGPAPAAIANQTIGCISSFYVRWLEASGIRVVPFQWNASGAQRDYLLAGLNGVYFMGGGLSGPALAEFFAYAQYIFDYAVAQNRAGSPFFVGGTCMGMQILSAAAARNLSVIRCEYGGMEPLMMPLNFTSHTASSRILGTQALSGWGTLANDLQNRNCTLNWHSCGISWESTAGTSFGDIFDVVTVNTDPVYGRLFFSTIEARGMNIFAAQFHSERPPYEFSDDRIGHNIVDVTVSQYMSQFVAQRLRANNHSFPGGATEVEQLVVENYPLVVEGYGHATYWILQ